jgi:hypothetical protein
MNRRKQVVFFRNTPQVNKSREEYNGCLMYLKMPRSINSEVLSNLYSDFSPLFISCFPNFLRRMVPLITI